MELPEKDELVIAVIRKIMPYGAFCTLPEYENMEAFLHVSEIAPRWIKNIHEFISEGQQQVAKIYRIDREKNQVDLSLKRVSEEEKKRKLELIRTEKRADKLLSVALKESGAKVSADEAREAIEKEFEDVWAAFTQAMERGEEALAKVDIPKSLKTQITAIAKKNIKKPSVEVMGILNLTCWGEDGIGDIRNILSAAGDVQISYLGAPRYKITLNASSYKEGEKKLEGIIKKMEDLAHSSTCDFSFELQRS